MSRPIENPIIRGFNPDPSILRVGEDYFIANSTFEWHPGIQIHHSRNLRDWELIGHALTTTNQLNMIGVPNSSGIWAPSLSYCDGLYYMVYSNVRTRTPRFKDLRNYLITAEHILGPWSEPVFLNASGFDPSLFHDDDGRKWVVNMEWDHRDGHPRFAGIILQEYDPEDQQLIGTPRTILQKEILIEGPNLYQLDGYYYLMVAQGGTGWQHSIAMARSKRIEGPYELDPQDVILTSKQDPMLELQKAGHGDLVQTPEGQWYLVHLCSRPVGKHRRCILGRETAVQRCRWTEEGWLRLASGGIEPQTILPTTVTEEVWKAAGKPECDHFDEDRLGVHWASLRHAVKASWLSLSERKGWVRIYGSESLHSLFEQSLIAQRLQSFRATAETRMQFKPTHSQHMAGLVCWYDTDNHYYLRVTHDEEAGVILEIAITDDGVYQELTDYRIQINGYREVYLKVEIDSELIQFQYSGDGICWSLIGPRLDMTKLSDDYADKLKFTGAMVGLCVQDLQGAGKFADFDYFKLI